MFIRVVRVWKASRESQTKKMKGMHSIRLLSKIMWD